MLTRHGWACLAAVVGAFAAGRLFGLVEMYVLGAALGAVLVVALVATNRRLPELRVRRVARPSMVSVGEPARVDIEVANRSARTTPRLRLWEPVGERGGAPMQLAPLTGHDAVTAAYRVPTSRRGVVRTGPLRADRTDLLGLCRRTFILAGTSEVMVAPERVMLAFPTVTSNGRLGQYLRMKSWGQTGTEFHSQREYVPGDDLRRINWKTSARANTLIVRETAVEGLQRCMVVLDTQAVNYDSDGFERAITAAASAVDAAVLAGVMTRLVAPGLDLRGPAVAHESLRWLAMVEPGDVVADPALTGGTGIDGLGLVVVATASAGTEAVAAARAVAGPDDVVLVVSTMDPASGGTAFVVDGTSLEAMQNGWNQLVHGAGRSPR